MPCFWDELGVYIQAVAWQYHHGLSLLPASVDAEYSRGHPLLFVFTNAALLRLTVPNVVVVHGLALLVSVLLLVVMYNKVARYYSPLAGLLSVVFLCLQPMFMAQSGMMLPEVPMALFFLLAVTACYEKNYLLFALYTSVGVLVKENAVLLPLAAMAYALLLWVLNGKRSEGLWIKNIFLTLLPLGVFAGFLGIQKQQLGWYFFPTHSDIFMQMPFTDRLARGLGYPAIVFVGQGRYVLTIAVVAAAAWAGFKNKLSTKAIAHSFILPLGIFSGIYLLFLCNSHSLMHRYTVPLVMGWCIAGGIAVISLPYKKLTALSLVVMLAGLSYHYAFAIVLNSQNKVSDVTFNLDTDLGYAARTQVIKEAVHFLEKNSKPGERVMGTFPCNFAFTNPLAGYLPPNPHLVWGRNADSTLPLHYINAVLPMSDGPPPMVTDPEYVDTSRYTLTLLKEFKQKENVVQVFKTRDNKLPAQKNTHGL